MSVEWIEDKRTKLTHIYQECIVAKEPALMAFSVYILRLLDGLAQMEHSRHYGYEDKIFGEALKIFCEHYAEQIETILHPAQELSMEERKKIAEDIEDSISKISMYKNAIDSISNLDLQMITSQAVESSIYSVSPKLFVTYSIILETLVRLFDKQGVYAFLLQPSLKSYVETISLFNRRKMEGKVVLIYLPENMIDNIWQIPMYMLHEVFHVLTRDERSRKERAINMESHMYNAVSQSLFKNINFDFTSFEDAQKIRYKLLKRWFKLEERMQQLTNMDDSSRQFYSKNIKEQICDNWREWLSETLVTLGNDLCQVLTEIEYREGTNPYEQLPLIEWNLHRNIVEILTYNRIKEYADIYMTVYREAYADVASILTTGILPDVYEQVFRDAEILHNDNAADQDIIRALRVHTVSRAVVGCKNIDHLDEWKKYSIKHDYVKWIHDIEEKERSAEKAKNNRINILKDDLDLFEDTIGKGSQKLWEKIGREGSSFESFRKIMRNMNLRDILNGKVNEGLQQLKA